jgi:hypothetical protein
VPRRHEERPEKGDLPPDVLKALEDLQGSDYHSYVRALAPLVSGRTVTGSSGGNSGFIVELDDGSYVVSYLNDGGLRWKHGADEPSAADFSLIASPRFGDATEPLPVDRPYAGERCDIPREVAKAHGHKIETLSIGRNCFNLAFDDNHELDTMIVTTSDGRVALRVFWEQW